MKPHQGQSPQQGAAAGGARSQPCTAPDARRGTSPPSALPLSARVCLGDASVHLPASLSHCIHAGGLHCSHLVCSASWPLSIHGVYPAGARVCSCSPAEWRLPPFNLLYRSCFPSPWPPPPAPIQLSISQWPAPSLLCLPLRFDPLQVWWQARCPPPPPRPVLDRGAQLHRPVGQDLLGWAPTGSSPPQLRSRASTRPAPHASGPELGLPFLLPTTFQGNFPCVRGGSRGSRRRSNSLKVTRLICGVLTAHS